MILFEGQVLQDDAQDEVLDKLWNSCIKAIEKRDAIGGSQGIAEKLINACAKVAGSIKEGKYDDILKPLMAKGTFTEAQFEEACSMFSKENLQEKYNTEYVRYKEEVETNESNRTVKRVEPLGILFHVAAGNAEGLPFFSVIEGMLAGNVNILKLPSMDDGISILLLSELIKEEPDLASYVCVLDVPSANLAIMKRLADMSDAVVVWGGDAAIQAIRTYASPNTQIISWGHKLSFAYISLGKNPDTVLPEFEEQLRGLAHHICQTRQLLCSSCQGIFVDTDDFELVGKVAEYFFDILKEVAIGYKKEAVGIRGKVSIAMYNQELESIHNEENTGDSTCGNADRIFLKDALTGVSVVAQNDSKLELSYMFKNCWVKPLLACNIVKQLKGCKGYLQTVGLMCNENRESVTNEMLKAGLVRVTTPANMSKTVIGETHDGEYPLRRYSKIVEISNK